MPAARLIEVKNGQGVLLSVGNHVYLRAYKGSSWGTTLYIFSIAAS
jgi:hypothetical protein